MNKNLNESNQGNTSFATSKADYSLIGPKQPNELSGGEGNGIHQSDVTTKGRVEKKYRERGYQGL